LRPLCIHRLFEIEIPEREMILEPIIPQKGLAMLYASRGIGKTHLACGISYAVATGSRVLKCEATKPRKVLHCDGEMPAVALRERFAQLMGSGTVRPEPNMLNILTADLIDLGIGNVTSPKVQAELDPLLDGVELLVLDNLSSLTSVVRDNDAESWGPIQEWLLRLRRRGVSVLIVHHAGKGGEQRGTSRREDVLDTSIALRRPGDYRSEQGARFEVHIEKGRGIHGEAAKPFEAQLEVRDDVALWTLREIEDVNLARVKALLDDGLKVREIAEEKRRVSRDQPLVASKSRSRRPPRRSHSMLRPEWDGPRLSHARRETFVPRAKVQFGTEGMDDVPPLLKGPKSTEGVFGTAWTRLATAKMPDLRDFEQEMGSDNPSDNQPLSEVKSFGGYAAGA
jgi:AAA domain